MAAALKKSLARNGAGSSGGDGYPSYCPCDARTARGDQLSPVECRVARPSGPTASSNRVEEIAEEVSRAGKAWAGGVRAMAAMAMAAEEAGPEASLEVGARADTWAAAVMAAVAWRVAAAKGAVVTGVEAWAVVLVAAKGEVVRGVA